MFESRRGTWAALWAAWGLCLTGFGCQVGGTADILRGSEKQGWASGPQVTRADYRSSLMGLDGSIAPAGGFKPATAALAKSSAPGENVALARMSGSPTTAASPPGAPCPPGGVPAGGPGVGFIPTELQKLSQPTYRIEPPDVLLIDTISMLPMPPYTILPLDALQVRVVGTLPEQPIDGVMLVGPDGAINLGYSYGFVRVAGLSVEQAQEEIKKKVSKVLKEPQVAIGVAQFRGLQQVRGEHLVRPDGTISLGSYGSVYVTGLTMEQVKLTIERHLSLFVLNPKIAVDVFAYNSKVYYIIADGAGYGQIVERFPATGNETVLDAISHIKGLPAVASKRHIWVSRPAPADHCCSQVLPVDWNAITQGGSTVTNYQIFPGDRIYMKADPLIAFDYAIAKVVSPIQRLFGVVLLGETTVRAFGPNNNNNSTPIVPILP